MRKKITLTFAMVAALVAGAALAQAPRDPERTPPPEDEQLASSGSQNLFYGGYLGLAFGTVQYVELSPLVGYRFAPQFGAGVGLLYRYTKDTRYHPAASASDYGGNLFLRYYLGSGFFGQAEYDYTSHTYVANSTTGATAREPYSSFLAGFGYNGAAGRGSGVYAVLLYDFNYSSSDPHPLYNSPWQIRVGVSVGF